MAYCFQTLCSDEESLTIFDRIQAVAESSRLLTTEFFQMPEAIGGNEHQHRNCAVVGNVNQ